MASFVELINRKAKRTDTEHSVWLRVFTYLAVALGIVAAGFSNELRAPALAGLAGITIGYTFSYYRREYTNWWSRVVLSLCMPVAGYVYVRQMFFSPRDHILVLTELLILLQVMHSFDLPRRKDLVYSILSAFMLVCVGGVLSRSPWYGAYLMAFLILALIMLLIYHYQEAGEGARVSGAPWQVMRLAPVVLGLLLIGFPVFFLLMPRYETHAFAGLPVSGRVRAMVQEYAGQVIYPEPPSHAGGPGGGPVIMDGETPMENFSVQYGQAYHGFMPAMDLNARGRLGNQLLMRVRTSGAMYYRGLVFDTYRNGRWSMAEPEGTRIANRSATSNIPLNRYKGHFLANIASDSEAVFQTFYFEEDMPNLIYAALEPEELYLPFSEIVMDRNISLRAAAVLQKGTVYTAVSRAPRYSPDRLRLSNKPCPDQLKAYCKTGDIPASVSAHAHRVTANADTNYDKLLMLRQNLVRHTAYDLDAPRAPRGTDPVAYFLFTSRRGYCEHYASAFTLMARSLDMPARLVTGFSPGRYNPLTGLFEIGGQHAHAWSEVYFPLIGWVPFDPTPPGPPGPLNFEDTTPLTFFMDEYVARAKEWLSGVSATLSGVLPRTGAGGASPALPAAVVMAIAIIFWLIIRSRTRSRTGPAAQLADSNRLVARLYHKTLRTLRRRGVEVTPATVPADVRSQLPEETRAPFDDLARLYERAGFSPHTLAPEDVQHARNCADRVAH